MSSTALVPTHYVNKKEESIVDYMHSVLKGKVYLLTNGIDPDGCRKAHLTYPYRSVKRIILRHKDLCSDYKSCYQHCDNCFTI